MAVWTDSALYGSLGEPLDDEDLVGYEKHRVYSQAGCLVGFLPRGELDSMHAVKVSFLDWRSRASKRVFHATFGAEAGAALEAVGMGMYLRAYFCDIMLGASGDHDVTDFGEDQLKMVLFTDCRSLYDNLKKDGSVPDDKWTAISIAAPRCAVSAGAERNDSKVECKWVASRWQLADCLTKPGLEKLIRVRLETATTKLHEESLNQHRRQGGGPRDALGDGSASDSPRRGRAAEKSGRTPVAAAAHVCSYLAWPRALSACPPLFLAGLGAMAPKTAGQSMMTSSVAASSDFMLRVSWQATMADKRARLREVERKLARCGDESEEQPTRPLAELYALIDETEDVELADQLEAEASRARAASRDARHREALETERDQILDEMARLDALREAKEEKGRRSGQKKGLDVRTKYDISSGRSVRLAIKKQRSRERAAMKRKAGVRERAAEQIKLQQAWHEKFDTGRTTERDWLRGKSFEHIEEHPDNPDTTHRRDLTPVERRAFLQEPEIPPWRKTGDEDAVKSRSWERPARSAAAKKKSWQKLKEKQKLRKAGVMRPKEKKMPRASAKGSRRDAWHECPGCGRVTRLETCLRCVASACFPGVSFSGSASSSSGLPRPIDEETAS